MTWISRRREARKSEEEMKVRKDAEREAWLLIAKNYPYEGNPVYNPPVDRYTKLWLKFRDTLTPRKEQ